VLEVRAEAPPFLPDLAEARTALATSPSLAFLCRPSNPGLGSLSLAALDELARAAPSTLFVVDEAYLPMFDGVEPASPRPNVAILRSLTKVFALPGLRLGYLIADTEVARVVQSALPPWNVSAPAAAAGRVACALAARIVEVRREIARLRAQLVERLMSPAVTLDAQGGPFLLYRVGDAAALERRLFERGLRVRGGASFGLPAHVRLGVRPEDEQLHLARAWHEVLS
jgi:histidinol-phosphate/aromatic aminotransferase/cobyric acid decarboxylase-like protein